MRAWQTGLRSDRAVFTPLKPCAITIPVRATAHLVRKARRTVPSSVVNSMSRFIVITFAEARFGPTGLGIGAPSDVGNGFRGSGLNGIVIAPRASKSWREETERPW
jgi:hypothetical protein